MKPRAQQTPALDGKLVFFLFLSLLLLTVSACAGGQKNPSAGSVGETMPGTVDLSENNTAPADVTQDKHLKNTDPEVLALDEEDDYFEDDAFEGDLAPELVISDPLEPWNRFWHGFNDGVINYAVRPVWTGYQFVTPEFVRKGLGNFFTNLKTPGRMVNCLLQGKGKEAGVEFSCFMLNTVGGLGGFFDVASGHKTVVPRTNEDFGQTLGKWGMGEGVYLVWPFLGPSNVRESFGNIGNWGISHFTSPFTYLDNVPWFMSEGVSALSGVNALGGILDTYGTLDNMSIDAYSAMRDGYTKLRRGAVAK